MKQKSLYFLFAVLFIASCKKEELGPMGLKHGQVVTVRVGHQYGAINDKPLLLPDHTPAAYALHGFNERKPGYNYEVKARVHLDRSDPPIQDAPPYWLDFIEVAKTEKYEGDESFQLALVQSHIPGGPVIMLRKHDGEYHFIPEKVTLRPANEQVAHLLAEIWEHNEPNFCYCNQPYVEPKWESITATATHDPENFGKSYLVSAIEWVER